MTENSATDTMGMTTNAAKPGARPYCSAQPQQISLPPFQEWAPSGLEHHAPKLPEAFWSKYAPKPHCVIRSPHAQIEPDW